MFNIRPFDYTDADYATMTAISAAFFPDWSMSAEQVQHIDDTRDPDLFFHRDLIEYNGAVAAYGEYGHSPWMFHPQKFFLHMYVHPDHEHPDIRRAYWQHMLGAVAGHDLIAIISGMQEGRDTPLHFLDEIGFREVMRELESELDVTAFDDARFAPIREKVCAVGIRIISLREFQALEPDWKHQLYELFWAILQDVPSPEAQVKPTIDAYEQMELSGPAFTADGYFVALEGDRLVGMSRLWLNQADNDKLIGGLTGVIRSHRRQGIATVLKLHGIDFARRQGQKTIFVANEESNPMYQLNRMLGFRPKPAWITFEKAL